MQKLLGSLIFAISLLVFPCLATAQFTVFIGSSSFTKQKFNCVTYPGGEDITVVAKGKSRIMEKKDAKRMVSNSVQSVTRKLNDTKGNLKDANALLKRLLKSPTIVLPKVAKQITQTRKQIEKLQAKLEKLKGQKDELKSVSQAIENCGKVPPVSNGTNVIRSGNKDLPLSGWQGYLISAMHVFAYHPSYGPRICVSINGGSKVSVGVQFNSCTTFNDGAGTSHPVSFCTENLGPGLGAIILGGKAGYYHLNRYSTDLQYVQDLLSTAVELSLPSASNPCPR